MEIKKYSKQLEKTVMDLIRGEGDEWICYWGENGADQYKKALADSITYVAMDGNRAVGYSRSLPDNGICIYVCDLLVDKAYRGNHLGRKLMEQILLDYPGPTVYVMSDVDGYYLKQGYHREGSVFEVKLAKQ